MEQLKDRISNTVQTIKAINGADTQDRVFICLLDYMRQLGFETVSLSPLVNPALFDFDISHIGRSTWPAEFLQSWLVNNYVIHDPIARKVLSTREPFFWSDAYEEASPEGKRILDEAATYGLTDGIAIPIHLPSLPPGGVTLSGARLDFTPEELAELQLVSTHAYSRVMSLVKFNELVKIPRLTNRECDVLHQVAAGKTNREIADIYSLSEHSVKDHMKNITIKFKASNRAHAVSLGVISGQIII